MVHPFGAFDNVDSYYSTYTAGYVSVTEVGILCATLVVELVIPVCQLDGPPL